MPPGWQEEGEEGKHCQLQTTCSSRRCAGAPQGRQAGSWHGAGPCGYPAPCGAPAAATGTVIFSISPFVIQTLVILSSAVVGQAPHCSVPLLSQAVNAEPPHFYCPPGSFSPTMCLQTPWPFPLPWLSPLGAARREGGGRWMAEPFLCFGESCFSPVASFKMRSGLSQTSTARSAALGRCPERLQLFRQTNKRRIEAVTLSPITFPFALPLPACQHWKSITETT